jgi:hypothetical protein
MRPRSLVRLQRSAQAPPINTPNIAEICR